MLIKRVKKTSLYDVFVGLGWKNHSRVSIHNGHVQLHSGNSLSKIQYVEIAKTVGRK